MLLNGPLYNRYVITSEGITGIPKQLIAKIEEHNQEDSKAMARAREERLKWLLAKKRDRGSQQP